MRREDREEEGEAESEDKSAVRVGRAHDGNEDGRELLRSASRSREEEESLQSGTGRRKVRFLRSLQSYAWLFGVGPGGACMERP